MRGRIQVKPRRSCWGWVVLCTVPLFGQSVQLSSVPASRGGSVTIELRLASPAGKELVALQWETRFPNSYLTLDQAGPVMGDAAKAAGKLLRCAARGEKKSPNSSYLCILAGGQKPIANGTLAILSFRISPKARTGAYPVTADSILAVSKDTKPITLPPAQGTITIGRK